MKLIIDIPEDRYKEIVSGIFDADGYFKTNLTLAFRNGTHIPDNATNGDNVKKMFCKGIVRISSRKNVSVEFNKNWWNAPYQKGGKE